MSLDPYNSSDSEETAYDNNVAAIENAQTILGKIGGNALWIQVDEAPDCECGFPMNAAFPCKLWPYLKHVAVSILGGGGAG